MADVMLAAESGLGTYRRSLSVVILTGVPRRCGAYGPLIVSVDFQLSAPELAVDECRSAATSRLVIVDCLLRVLGLLLPFDTAWWWVSAELGRGRYVVTGRFIVRRRVLG